MSLRHYVSIEKDGEEVWKMQVLGNNDLFDELFYEHLNINVDEDGWVEKTQLNLPEFLIEWHEWLERHIEKQFKGPKIEKNENYAKLVFMEYSFANYYQFQPYQFAKGISEFVNYITGDLIDGYTMFLEAY